jgi:biopolymer transport protein TolQ
MADLLNQLLSEVSLWLSFGMPDFVAQAAPTPQVTQENVSAPINISLWALFWQAHLVVKAVMMGLIVASVWVWAIVIDKTILYARTRRQMDRFEQAFWSGESLEDLYR